MPFAAGSGTDNAARVFGEAGRLAAGRTVIVDDKPGGGGTIGSLEVSRADIEINDELLEPAVSDATAAGLIDRRRDDPGLVLLTDAGRKAAGA